MVSQLLPPEEQPRGHRMMRLGTWRVQRGSGCRAHPPQLPHAQCGQGHAALCTRVVAHELQFDLRHLYVNDLRATATPKANAVVGRRSRRVGKPATLLQWLRWGVAIHWRRPLQAAADVRLDGEVHESYESCQLLRRLPHAVQLILREDERPQAPELARHRLYPLRHGALQKLGALSEGGSYCSHRRCSPGRTILEHFLFLLCKCRGTRTVLQNDRLAHLELRR
mmetsp:Transcript_72401/g.203276  ORF Transcript_72401/g.203276 Transcript_72401/m.203276 type:complete len:224 (-) Transcript_72401:342-1013(-)